MEILWLVFMVGVWSKVQDADQMWESNTILQHKDTCGLM